MLIYDLQLAHEIQRQLIKKYPYKSKSVQGDSKCGF